jgi:hypothetical protein
VAEGVVPDDGGGRQDGEQQRQDEEHDLEVHGGMEVLSGSVVRRIGVARSLDWLFSPRFSTFYSRRSSRVVFFIHWSPTGWPDWTNFRNLGDFLKFGYFF